MTAHRSIRTTAATPDRAIVLGGHYCALAVVRSLARAGIRVMVVSSDRHGHACHSRRVSELLVSADPAEDGVALLDALMRIDDAWSGALLIPTLDEYVEFVSRNRDELARRFVFAVPEWDVVGGIIEKDQLYAAARDADVPAPDFLVPTSVESLVEWRDSRAFPCIVKPYEARAFSEIYGAKVLVARDFDDLVEKYLDTQAHGLDVMVCEIIPGEDSSLFVYACYIDTHGEVLGEMCTNKLRQYPQTFGQGAVVRSVPMIPEIRDLSLRLLRSSGYRGEASAEFRLDARDGRYKLMEINVRPIVTESLFVEAGVDFPLLTYRDVVLDSRIAPPSYDTELTWIHNHWEPVNFIRLWRARRLDPREFFSIWGKRRVFAIAFFDDPVHFVREGLHYMGLGFQRIGDPPL